MKTKNVCQDIVEKGTIVFTFAFIVFIVGMISNARGSDWLAFLIILPCIILVPILLMIENDRVFMLILLSTFTVKMALALVNLYIMPLPDSTADARVFEQLGWDIAEALYNSTAIPDAPGAYQYSVVIGYLYYFIGKIPLMAEFLNVILGVGIVYYVYKMVMEIGERKKIAQLASIIAAFFPTLNLYSAITMRENFIVFFAAVSFYYFIKWTNSGKVKDIMIAGVMLLGSSLFHGAIILIGGIYALFFCFYNSKLKKWDFYSKRALTAVILVGLFMVVVVIKKEVFLNKIPSVSMILSPEYHESRSEVLAIGRGAYLIGFYPSSLFDIILQTPIRMFYFIFSPLPWMMSSPADLVGFMDASLYFILLVYSIKGLKEIKTKNKAVFFASLMIAFLVIAVFAWGTSNYGTAIRHRQKIVWLFIVCASFGMTKIKSIINKEINTNHDVIQNRSPH